MKKLIAVLLIAAMCALPLASCKGGTSVPTPGTGITQTGKPTSETPTQTPTEAPTEKPTESVTTPDGPDAPDDPYALTAEVPADGVIRTAAELQAVLTKGVLSATYRVEAEALDMSRVKYPGLGTDTEAFSGNFDFGGCTVSGLSSPLFNYTEDAEIANLTVADTDISFTKSGVAAYGLIVSSMKGGSLKNIRLSESVKLDVNLYTTNARLGGIVGKVEGGKKAVLLDGCVSYGTLVTDSDKIWMGGIAGSVNAADAIVSECINYGSVTDNAIGYDSKIGGIAGSAKTVTFRRCANYGDVTSNEEKGQAAGICAYFEGSAFLITACFNQGKVSGGQYTGGIVAYTNRDSGTVEWCINLGTVENSAKDGYLSAALWGCAKKKEVIRDCYWLATSNATGATTQNDAKQERLESFADLDALRALLETKEELKNSFTVTETGLAFAAKGE